MLLFCGAAIAIKSAIKGTFAKKRSWMNLKCLVGQNKRPKKQWDNTGLELGKNQKHTEFPLFLVVSKMNTGTK